MAKAKSKYDQVYEYITRKIMPTLKVGQKMPTETEIANLLGVNRMTVAKTMSALASQGLVDRCPGRGSTLIRHTTEVIPQGIITLLPGTKLENSLNDPHYATVAQAMTLAAFDHGWTNTLAPIAIDNANNFSSLRSAWSTGAYHGIVVTPGYRDYIEPINRVCGQLGAPIVWVSAGTSLPHMNLRVGVDNHQATRALCEHLIARGCQRIGLIGGETLSSESEDRIKSYYKTLRSHGLEIIEDHVFLGNVGVEAAHYFAARTNAIDGLFVLGSSLIQKIEQVMSELPDNHPLGRIPMVTFDYRLGSTRPMVVASAIQPITHIAQAACDMIEVACSETPAFTDSRFFNARIITHRDEAIFPIPDNDEPILSSR